jgi:hypothetical protein
MECLDSLQMTDLILDPSPLPLPASTVPDLISLELEDIHDSQSLAEIFDVLTNASKITVTHSATGYIARFHRGNLTLEDFDEDQDLVPLLRCWQGFHLTVKRCPGFNDAVLRMMTPREDGTHNCAQDMVKLVIVSSPNYSVAALKQLVSAKLNGRAIESLRVSRDGPVISFEDYWWLSENTDFGYTSF